MKKFKIAYTKSLAIFSNKNNLKFTSCAIVSQKKCKSPDIPKIITN